MKRLIIDRFEGSFAICEKEDDTTEKIPRYKLPLDCREGDCLLLGSEGMYTIDTNATKIKEKRIQDKMNRLFK